MEWKHFKILVAVVLAASAFSLIESAISTPFGTYGNTTEVESELGVSQLAEKVAGEMKDEKYAGAKQLYLDSPYVKGLARGSNFSDPTFRKASEHFRSEDFNEEYLLSAFDTGAHESRVEMVQKTLADSIPVYALLSLAYEGVQNNAQDLWDKAAALYFGTIDTELTPFTRANKRDMNFATTRDDSSDALVNAAVFSAFDAGPSESGYNAILHSIKTIYTQCVLRYAHLIDEAVTKNSGQGLKDYRAEGQAFYRIVAPMVDEMDPKCDKDMTQLFDIGGSEPATHGRYYCRALSCVPSALKQTSDDIGTLENTEGKCDLHTPVATYETESDVEDELWITDTVDKIVQLTVKDEIDKAQQTYQDDKHLYALAKGNGLSGEVFDQYVQYFDGHRDFNNRYMTKAFQFPVSASRNEMVQKTLADAIPFQAILSFANSGASGNRGDWDKAAAFYVGILDKELSPYSRANKRGANFGTTMPGDNEALVNQQVLNAFQTPSMASYEIILKSLKTIYTQASLRYARLLDVDVTSTPQLSTDDHRAEGQAFYRIIAPFVKESDASCDTQMTHLFSFETQLETHGQYYCMVLACLPAAMDISGDELGVLEETEVICVGEAGQQIVTPVGRFVPQTNVVEDLQVSNTVASIMSKINAGDYSGAKLIYVDTYLMDLAKGNGLQGPVFEQFQTHFGNKGFNHEYLMDKAFANDNQASKNEMIEKTVADAVPAQALISLAHDGAHNGVRSSWDKAAALYIGVLSSGYSPYNRANKRGANFGTEVAGSDGTMQAMVNQKILEAFQNQNMDSYETVVEGLKIIYAQASIRYARLLDIDVTSTPQLSTDDHRAEGQAFYRIIEPFVAQADPACHTQMKNLYSFSTVLETHGKYFCMANDCVPKALQISAEQLGELEETKNVCNEKTGLEVEDSGSVASAKTAGLLFLVFAVFM